MLISYRIDIGIGQYSRLQYRYRIGSEKVVSGHPYSQVLPIFTTAISVTLTGHDIVCVHVCSSNVLHGWRANSEKCSGTIIGARGYESPNFQWDNRGQTGLDLQTKWDSEVGTWHRINGRSWRPLDPYDKVMKERRMAGVQPGRAWGPPCLTNTLCARWTDGSRIQKKTVLVEEAHAV